MTFAYIEAQARVRAGTRDNARRAWRRLRFWDAMTHPAGTWAFRIIGVALILHLVITGSCTTSAEEFSP